MGHLDIAALRAMPRNADHYEQGRHRISTAFKKLNPFRKAS
jgi:hypothetical protein